MRIKFTSKHNCFIALVLFTILISSTALKAQVPIYPRITGYFGVSNSVGTWTTNGFTSNFGNSYTVSFPMGLNLIKSDHFGVSFELSPAIQTTNNVSKMSSMTLAPGAMFRLKNAFNVFTRVCFETSGRFGFSPSISKTVIKGKDANLFVSTSVPIRFGNDLPASVGASIIVGVSF